MGRGPRLGADGVNAINEETGGVRPPAPPLLAAGALGRLKVVAGRLDGRHELRPFSASGLPGPRYGQKTNLNPTSGDLWVWASS